MDEVVSQGQAAKTARIAVRHQRKEIKRDSELWAWLTEFHFRQGGSESEELSHVEAL